MFQCFCHQKSLCVCLRSKKHVECICLLHRAFAGLIFLCGIFLNLHQFPAFCWQICGWQQKLKKQWAQQTCSCPHKPPHLHKCSWAVDAVCAFETSRSAAVLTAHGSFLIIGTLVCGNPPSETNNKITTFIYKDQKDNTRAVGCPHTATVKVLTKNHHIQLFLLFSSTAAFMCI